LEANPYYHRTRAQVDQVRYQFKPKGYQSFKAAAEWANDAHIMRGLGLASYDYLKDRKDLTLDVVRTGEIEHLLFNLDNPILADRRVRRALAYATDRKEIRKLLLGLGDNAFSDQIKASWKYDPQTESYYPFSDDTAARQLDLAGWTVPSKAAASAVRTMGQDPLVLDLTLEQGNRSHAVIGRYLQNAWKAVGVDLKLKFVAPRILQAEVLPRRDYMLTFSTWHEDGRETPYLRWHSTQKAPQGLNYSGFSDYQVDVVTQALQKTVDISEQKRLYTQLSQLLAEELPALPLYYGVELEAHKKSLQNFEPNQQASLSWNSADWWLK
jgi:peptide/nickel transport system substrate-binding protein